MIWATTGLPPEQGWSARHTYSGGAKLAPPELGKTRDKAAESAAGMVIAIDSFTQESAKNPINYGGVILDW